MASNIVHDFITAKVELFRHFKCADEYYIQTKLGHNWEIAEEEGMFFLNYWENIHHKTTAVIVKKNEMPQIFKAEDYTMVIAIDCVRIAFVFNNVLNYGNILR